MSHSKAYFISSVLAVLGTLGFAMADAPPMKGRVPEQAFGHAGVNLELVPDYVVAYARDGSLAGYIRKDELFNEKGMRRSARLTVVDETLARPVGHMVPNRGFVPIGLPDDSVPEFAP